MAPVVNSWTFSFSYFALGLVTVQWCEWQVGVKHLLANDGKSTEDKCVDIIREHGINDAGPIEACQLGLSFCWCLQYLALSSITQ
jgi:hypothetical protein